ncbi:PREDICTED: ATP-dependent DNA helicase Q-like SIM [Branchiostoma belcheri]|uniref:DNA 3'-5' helicase n=1 Tax=Branchiostoma belcheri TaxID=7741 RepID=A0A6P5AFP2_BRABE|nr:PREDICTED: ATP-dependent DNA helicase Q-like SIM [Branchiostoma belcheri]
MAASSTVEGEFRPLLESVCKDFGRPWPLKPLQEKAVTYFVQRRKDIFACLPTGYGKTELYTLVPLVMERLLGKHCVMLVVSPLLSLMQDQVQRLQQGGIKAAYVGETQEDADIKRGVIEGKYSLVFVSPEAILNSKSWRGMLTNKTYREHLVGVAVDEAHCITSWGGEFRKDYKRLAELRSLLGDVPFMTLTATATEEIRKDILSSLCMDLDTFTVSVPSNRPNIMYHAVPSSHDSRKEFGWLVEELKSKGQSCRKYIIYCRSIKSCSQLYDMFMTSLGDDAYNLVCNMMTKSYRNRRVAINTDSMVRVTIATVAFGMGIDVPDVLAVIHWGAPRHVEGFYQESGRGGRDGRPSHSLILHQSRTLAKGSCSQSMSGYCKLASGSCRRKYLLDYFKLKSSDTHSSVEVSDKDTCCDLCVECGDSFPWNKHEGLSSVPELSDEELLKVSSYRQPTEEQLHMLKESLIDYRNDLLDEMKPSLYNFDITIGLSLSTIDNIVDSCATLVARDDIITNIGLWDEEVVDMVFTILEESFQ